MKHLARRLVGEEHALFRAERDNAFNHAAEDGAQLLPIGFQLLELGLQSSAHRVEGGGQRTAFSPNAAGNAMAVFSLCNPVCGIGEFLKRLDEATRKSQSGENPPRDSARIGT